MKQIPEHAKKVFSGIMFDIRQREQEMFDGSTSTFEVATREHTVCVFATQWDKLVMTHQKQPQKPDRYRDVPWGRVSREADLLDHAKLELLEETGMESNDWQLYTSYTSGGKVYQYINYYIAKDVYKVAEQSLDAWGEIINVELLSFDEVMEMIVSGEIADVYLRNHILEMKLEGKIEEFRKCLFG